MPALFFGGGLDADDVFGEFFFGELFGVGGEVGVGGAFAVVGGVGKGDSQVVGFKLVGVEDLKFHGVEDAGGW